MVDSQFQNNLQIAYNFTSKCIASYGAAFCCDVMVQEGIADSEEYTLSEALCKGDFCTISSISNIETQMFVVFDHCKVSAMSRLDMLLRTGVTLEQACLALDQKFRVWASWAISAPLICRGFICDDDWSAIIIGWAAAHGVQEWTVGLPEIHSLTALLNIASKKNVMETSSEVAGILALHTLGIPLAKTARAHSHEVLERHQIHTNHSLPDFCYGDNDLIVQHLLQLANRS